MTDKKGLVGTLYGIEINHQNNVGDTRKHTEKDCWCWKEFNMTDEVDELNTDVSKQLRKIITSSVSTYINGNGASDESVKMLANLITQQQHLLLDRVEREVIKKPNILPKSPHSQEGIKQGINFTLKRQRQAIQTIKESLK